MKLPKVYEPGQYEADIYALWEQAGAFAPAGHGKPYSIVVPPPNANGNLHLGHALTMAIQDSSVRYHRLRGDRAVLLPGADHAGFETQVVFEKQLAAEGKSRFDFSREELHHRIYDFVQGNLTEFNQQFRRLGAGVDWDRFTFTLDQPVVSRAYQTFKKLWEEGLVYRGERLVNYCTFHGTAFADIEVVHKEDKGHLWYIRYPLTDGSGEVIVATTRPETMLGDTGVAVHPDDERYQAFIGKTVKLPLTNREIPIIADDFVDRTFGTGAVKLTPAHDPNDYEAARRHDLPFITVITSEGTLSHEVPATYQGLTVKEARDRVATDLAEQGFLDKTEDYSHSVGHCYKCDTVIEPLLREQWFLKMAPLAEPAIKLLKANKQITFYPDSKRTQLITYLEGLKDWNLSRQIAWGIPIPAFQNVDQPDDWIFDTRVDQEIIEIDGKTYHRDPDVFDTWFSSSSWPYVTTGYPDNPAGKEFYPLSLMETGFDILFPWVSRMLMLGLYVTGTVPFKAVYLHGLVLDEKGAKMSKSKGNVISPLAIIDQYGSDALRMGILTGQTPGNNQPFTVSKVVSARNFCNKLWNIARYVEGLLGDDATTAGAKPETAADHWVLQKLQQTMTAVETDMAAYRLPEAYERLYHFVWDDLADWYIEASKTAPNKPLLAYLLEATLTLLHPFAPFVTETIWQTLGWEGPDSLLATRRWPQPPKAEAKPAQAFTELQAIVSESRFIIAALQVTDVTLYYTDVDFLRDNAELIQRLAHLKAVTEVRDGNGLYLTDTPYRCWLDIDSATARHYREQLERKQAEQRQVIDQLEQRLGNEQYVKRAPHHLVAESKRQLADATAQLQKLQDEADRFAF